MHLCVFSVGSVIDVIGVCNDEVWVVIGTRFVCVRIRSVEL